MHLHSITQFFSQIITGVDVCVSGCYLLKANKSTCNDGNLSYTCWFSSLALDEPSEPLSPLFNDIKFILRINIEEEKSQNDLK